MQNYTFFMKIPKNSPAFFKTELLFHFFNANVIIHITAR